MAVALKKNDIAIAVKKDANEKKREQRKKIDNLFKGSDAPTLRVLDYKLSLIQALNWFNLFSTEKEKKEWTIQFITDKTQKSLLSKLDDISFKQIGTLIKLKNDGNHLEDNELNFIDTKLNELLLEAQQQVDAKKDVKVIPKPIISTQDKNKVAIEEFANSIDQDIDTFITSGYPKDYKFKSSVRTLSSTVVKQIPALYKNLIIELEEVLGGTCVELEDSYSHIKTVQVKRFHQLMTNLVSSCNQQVVSAKISKVSKPKPPSEVVKNLKYLIKYDELNLKSENPIKILGSKTVWLYDTVKRKLSYYVASNGNTLSVKGTTILGYDVESSGLKSIRKDEVLKDFMMMNNKQLTAQYENIRTKGQLVNGRTNMNEILLKVFK